MIVDSPGIGESRQMTQMVKDYFPTAFSFIYVINSANAGGLQPDRVGESRPAKTELLSFFKPAKFCFAHYGLNSTPTDTRFYHDKGGQ